MTQPFNLFVLATVIAVAVVAAASFSGVQVAPRFPPSPICPHTENLDIVGTGVASEDFSVSSYKEYLAEWDKTGHGKFGYAIGHDLKPLSLARCQDSYHSSRTGAAKICGDEGVNCANFKDFPCDFTPLNEPPAASCPEPTCSGGDYTTNEGNQGGKVTITCTSIVAGGTATCSCDPHYKQIIIDYSKLKNPPRIGIGPQNIQSGQQENAPAPTTTAPNQQETPLTPSEPWPSSTP